MLEGYAISEVCISFVGACGWRLFKHCECNNIWYAYALCMFFVTEGETDLVAGISQIPGLSPVLKGPPDEKNRGRRVGVLESDSEYVKLAKQGGHKGKNIFFSYLQYIDVSLGCSYVYIHFSHVAF